MTESLSQIKSAGKKMYVAVDSPDTKPVVLEMGIKELGFVQDFMQNLLLKRHAKRVNRSFTSFMGNRLNRKKVEVEIPVRADLLFIEAVVTITGLTKQGIYAAEKRGELFSVIDPARQRGRTYPKFQFDADISRPSLHLLIKEVRKNELSTNAFYGLMQSMLPEFAFLTGIEMLRTHLPKRKRIDKPLWNQLAALPNEERASFTREVVVQLLKERGS